MGGNLGLLKDITNDVYDRQISEREWEIYVTSKAKGLPTPEEIIYACQQLGEKHGGEWQLKADQTGSDRVGYVICERIDPPPKAPEPPKPFWPYIVAGLLSLLVVGGASYLIYSRNRRMKAVSTQNK